MAGTAVGHFNDGAAADAAYDELLARGFPRGDISLLGRGRDGGGLADDDDLITTQDGLKIGGIGGLLLGAAVMLIPGIGPILAVGPVAAALAGMVTGGVTGAVLGGVAAGLVHAGLSEDEATYYDEQFRQGGYLITVHTDAAGCDKARTVLAHHGAAMASGSSVNSDTATQGTVMPANDDGGAAQASTRPATTDEAAW